jgi:GTP-binding protein Era
MKDMTAEEKKAYRVGYVALIGRPNVGKSTLLNRIIGQKLAIVSSHPQTTRVSILGIHTTEKGQLIFIDNPGIHKPLHKLNKRMMNFVHSSLETSDLICLLIDASQKFGHGDEYVLEILKNVKTPLFLLINKVDAVKKSSILLTIDRYKNLLDFKEIIPLSALLGTNVDVFEKLVYGYLPASEKLYGDADISDQSERFLLAEIIREKVLNHVEAELPWATAVYIERIEKRKPEGQDSEPELKPETLRNDLEPTDVERPERRIAVRRVGRSAPANRDGEKQKQTKTERKRRPVTYVKASIFVEKENHRGIILGRRGQLIKTIGIEARQEIENILESVVFLDLQVKVRTRWRDSADVLDLIEGQK